jgi:hypothetical protein
MSWTRRRRKGRSVGWTECRGFRNGWSYRRCRGRSSGYTGSEGGSGHRGIFWRGSVLKAGKGIRPVGLIA